LSQKLLDEGVHFCVLYTDLSTVSSNALYQRVGYRPIEDVGDVALSPSQGS
jgi:predicted GNAT family acetyltransferase